MKTLTFLLTIVTLLSSCGKHRDGTSVWAGGLWIIPVLTTIGAFIFFVNAFRASQSGSTKYNQSTGKTESSSENVPIYKSGFFWFGLACAVATIVIAFVVNAEKG